jgi:hypothetical protein
MKPQMWTCPTQGCSAIEVEDEKEEKEEKQKQ